LEPAATTTIALDLMGRGYFEPVIDIGALKDRMDEGRDWVMFGPGGDLREPGVPPNAGPATLLVSRVTDAVKRLGDDGLIASSVDRRRLWAVEGFLLNRVVVEKLEPGSLDADSLLETVPRTGIGWQVVTGSE
ncbi:MAG: hypothetical protein ACRDVL_06905, partial [Acidimicrobiia bacterium]